MASTAIADKRRRAKEKNRKVLPTAPTKSKEETLFTVFIAIYMLIIIIIALPILLLCYLIGMFSTGAVKKIAFICAKVWAKGSLFCGGVRLVVKGRENIPDEPVLFVGNHRSFFDILIFYATTPKLAGFIARKEIKKMPIISNWMSLLGCLFLDRNDNRSALKTILKGVEQIKNGDSVFIFPEGTRSKDANVGRFKEGSLKIAEKTGCAIVPIAIKGSDERFERHKGNVHPGKCRIKFGKPVYLRELGEENRKQAGKYIREVIIQLLNEDYSSLQ